MSSETIHRLQQSLHTTFNETTEDKWLKDILNLEEENILSNNSLINKVKYYWRNNNNRETPQEEIKQLPKEEEIRKEIELILGGSVEEWIVDSEQAFHFRNPKKETKQISQINDLNPKIQIIGLEITHNQDQLINTKTHKLFVCGELKHGASSISQTAFTSMIPYQQFPQWNEFLTFDVLLSDLPRETTICLSIFARNELTIFRNESLNTTLESDILIGYLILPIFNFKGVLKQGEFLKEIWPKQMTNFPIENKASEEPIFIRYRIDFNSYSNSYSNSDFNSDLKSDSEFDSEKKIDSEVVVEFTNEINESMEESFELFENKIHNFFKNLPQEEQFERIRNEIITKDSLTQEDRWLLWLNREYLIEYPNALYKFILSVPWNLPKGVQIAHSLIPKWKINPMDTLELLSFNIADSKVREYALKKLDQLDNSQLINILYPLVQSLKYELYHDSHLSRFLIERSLKSNQIGHFLFWYLKSEMHLIPFKERYCLLLEDYLKKSTSELRREFLKQVYILNQLLNISIKIKQDEIKDTTKFRKLLETIKHPKIYKLPISPNLQVSGIIPEKCKLFRSKIQLCFKNADENGNEINVLFCTGKDLRVHQFVLQMFNIMDQLWKKEGLNIIMKPYACICTGDLIGMIQMVENSNTIANLIGGIGGIRPFGRISKFLSEFCKDENQEMVIDNFIHSYAGYLPALFVFGISDRHNDNILFTTKGDYFSIDLDYFLGNQPYFHGFRWQIEEFHWIEITKMYIEVMESDKNYNKFLELTCQAFNILCENERMFISICTLMIGADLPGLSEMKSILILKKRLLSNTPKHCIFHSPTSNAQERGKYFKLKIEEKLEYVKYMFNRSRTVTVRKEPDGC